MLIIAGNARLAGFEKDLGLKRYDYNIVLSVFYVSYIVFEIPSNLACKWIGPGWYIPAITLAFGIVSIGTAFVHSLSSVCAVRFLLGIFEAGMLPGIAYYMSRWYRRSELAFRLSLYLVMAPLAGAFGGLLASGILRLDSFGGLTRWRMIFAIEGIITCGLALIAFFTLTDRPETARWLTQAEKDLAIARVKSERVGTTEVLDRIDLHKTLRGILSPVTLSTAFIFLLNNITVQGLAFFAPTIVRTIYPHNTVISQQLYTVCKPSWYFINFSEYICFSRTFQIALVWLVDRRLTRVSLGTAICRGCFFYGPQSIHQLENQQAPRSNDWSCALGDGRLHNVPSQYLGHSEVRCDVPHCKRCICEWSFVPSSRRGERLV